MTDVDVVIAVHSSTRPIERAVGSVLASGTGARAVVVAHGIPVAGVESRLAGLPTDRVRVLPFIDGIPSPAGPFNAGLSAADADYVTVLGSDDELEPGSIDTAVRRITESRAEVCILPQRHADGPRIDTPLVRTTRQGRVDFVRDRLATRTAPLAVIPLHAARALAPLFDPRFRNGEDIAAGVRLWTGYACVYHRTDPGYVIHHDAEDRVTTALGIELEAVLEAPRAIASEPWVSRLDARRRQSLAAKMIRVHLLGVLGRVENIDDQGIAAALDLIHAWSQHAPGAKRALSRVDRAVLDAAETGDPAALTTAIERRATAPAWDRLIPRNPLRVLDRDGDVRRLLAYRAYRRAEQR